MMDKAQLKQILKPIIRDCIREGIKEEDSLIRQCIREIIFEDGTISKLISEAVRGLGSVQVLSEAPKRPSQKPQSAVQVLGHLTPETTLEEDEVLAEQEKMKRSKVRQALENDRKELISERKRTMERVLGATGVPMNVFESVDIGSLPASTVASRNKIGGIADLGANPRGVKGDGNAAMPLRGFNPNDAGVPITGILNLVGGARKWTSQLNE